MVTAAAVYHVLHAVNITIDVREVCVFLAPLFSSLTVLVTYYLTKELKVRRAWWVGGGGGGGVWGGGGGGGGWGRGVLAQGTHFLLRFVPQ